MPIDRRRFLQAAAATGALAFPCSFAPSVFADQDNQPFTGEIPDDEKTPGRAVNSLGRSGVVLIRSKAHSDWLMSSLFAAGLLPMGGRPNPFDFSTRSIAMILHYGDEGEKFAVHKNETNEKRTQLDVVMSYIIYKSRGKEVNKFQFFGVPIPKRDETAISIGTFHPHNGGMYPSADKAHREWSHTFTAADGDIVDGLQARIRPENTKIKRGEDIRCEFSLVFQTAARENGPFCQTASSTFVWDGKYSNGYRNHSFLVEFPDGSSKVFQPEEIQDWSKNAPHPVEVSEKKPYVLPEWFEGKTFKSLQKLGLETKLPGKYIVTGLYAEDAGPGKLFGPERKMWGGRIASAPVTIEVT